MVFFLTLKKGFHHFGIFHPSYLDIQDINMLTSQWNPLAECCAFVFVTDSSPKTKFIFKLWCSFASQSFWMSVLQSLFSAFPNWSCHGIGRLFFPELSACAGRSAVSLAWCMNWRTHLGFSTNSKSLLARRGSLCWAFCSSISVMWFLERSPWASGSEAGDWAPVKLFVAEWSKHSTYFWKGTV